jgi:hypothetical protein
MGEALLNHEKYHSIMHVSHVLLQSTVCVPGIRLEGLKKISAGYFLTSFFLPGIHIIFIYCHDFGQYWEGIV